MVRIRTTDGPKNALSPCVHTPYLDLINLPLTRSGAALGCGSASALAGAPASAMLPVQLLLFIVLLLVLSCAFTAVAGSVSSERVFQPYRVVS